MQDSVQIKCTKCKSSFRDRARRLQNGYSRQCPNCEVILFFEDDSFDKNVQLAMREAKRVRRALREEAEKSFATNDSPGPEQARTPSSRQVDRGRRPKQGRSEES
jgi:predicted  nucleic acid-binding Zn-ribbon protein